jgi:elongation factor P--beta-lysine ligase
MSCINTVSTSAWIPECAGMTTRVDRLLGVMLFNLKSQITAVRFTMEGMNRTN